MATLKTENGTIEYKFRLPTDEHKDYIINLIRTFGFHYIKHHNEKHDWKIDRLEIMKQDARGALSLSLLSGSRYVNQAWHGYTGKELIKFMQGFIFDKPFITKDS